MALWTCLAAAILWVDYLSGPDVAFPYLFLVPVALATRFNGRSWGLVFAIGLPLVRFCFYCIWQDHLSLLDTVLNAVIRMAVLVGAAILIDRVIRQAREIRVLRGFLPICSFCKRIRTPDQRWQPIEAYIPEHSDARFSHTFCPECGRANYGDVPGYDDLFPEEKKTPPR